MIKPFIFDRLSKITKKYNHNTDISIKYLCMVVIAVPILILGLLIYCYDNEYYKDGTITILRQLRQDD